MQPQIASPRLQSIGTMPQTEVWGFDTIIRSPT